MRNKIIKPGVSITKVLVWNRCGGEDDESSDCELTFSDGTSVMYECDDVDELEKENEGIYELQPDGTYVQVEDWCQ